MKKIALAVALALGGAVLAGPVAAMPAGPLALPSAASDVQQVQYIYGGRNYCWYGNGWHGPGYYWCGYAFRRGFGWGGGYGWRGWGGGGRGPRVGYYRGGGYRGGGFHGGGFHGGHGGHR
jgi:hypothetical protein